MSLFTFQVYTHQPEVERMLRLILERIDEMAEDITQLQASEDAEGAALTALITNQGAVLQKLADALAQIAGAGGNQAAIDALTTEAQAHVQAANDANAALLAALNP